MSERGEIAELDRDALLAAIAQDERELARIKGRQLARIARLDDHPIPGVPPGHADDSTRDELQCLLRLGSGTARALLDQARTLRDRLPGTASLLAAGEISEPHTKRMIEQTAYLTAEQCAEVEERVLTRAPRQSAPNFARSVRRMALQVAPETAEERRHRSERDRRVIRCRADSGVTELVATLPDVDAWTCWLALDTRARTKLEGDTRTLDQRRADAFTDICKDWLADRLGGHGAKVVPVIYVTMTLAAFLGRSDEPAEVDGVGPISRGVAHQLMFAHGAVFTRSLVDEDGVVIGLDPKTYRDGSDLSRHLYDPIEPTTHSPGCRGEGVDPYRPGTAQTNLVQARDPVCLFPFCGRRAETCDNDHTKDHRRGGPSCHCNLHPLCRRHHNGKTRKIWTLANDAAGILTWTSPTGREYRID